MPWVPCSTASPTIRRGRRARRSASPRATAASRIGELGWLPEADNEKFKGHAKAAIGLWGYSSKVNDQRDTRCRRQPAAAQASAEAMCSASARWLRLGGDEARFLSGFARYTWGDGDSTAVKNSLNLGLHLKGPLASRPDDIVGLAWSRAGMSQKWRDVQAVPADTKSSEDALEITWRFAVTPYLAIQPNYQYIRNPGGASAPNAKLIGVRVDRRAVGFAAGKADGAP
jgi:carbohydrate-selective porin OprB